MHELLKRSQVCQIEFERLECQEITAFCIGQPGAVRLDDAADPETGRGTSLEGHLEIGIERGRLQLHGQSGRDITPIRGQVQTLEFQSGVGLAVI